jgi:predicted nucleic acid-binding protein
MSAPTRLTFIDTNVLVYAHDGTEPLRRPVAQRVLLDLWTSGTGALSTQVLQEFYSTATCKIRKPLRPAVARTTVARYSEWCTVETDPLLIISAARMAEEHSIAFWDAMIIEAALRCDAYQLLTEDMQDGRKFGSLTVHNPFA